MKKQKKCPGCGLANFREADECQWCALALSGRARAEVSYEERAGSGAPWGLMLIAFAVLVICGGVAWHVTQKTVARLNRPAAEATEAGGRDAPPPSGRTEDGYKDLRKLGAPEEVVGRTRRQNEEFRRVLEEHERGVYGAAEDPEKARERERAAARPFRQPPVIREVRPNPYHAPAKPRDMPDSW